MKKIKGVFLDGFHHEVLEIDYTLDSFHKLLGCSCIDITRRLINGVYYWVICDDEGLLKDNQVTALYRDFISGNYTIAFVGKIFVVGFDGFDDVCSLEDNEINHLLQYIKKGILLIKR